MVVPIRDKGDSIVIVALNNGEPVMGYVTKATLDDYFRNDITTCEGLRVVRSNLQAFETIVAAKSDALGGSEGRMICVEMTLSDLQNSSRPLSHPGGHLPDELRRTP